MGDVIHALPAVATLKTSFPKSHVAWVVNPRWAPLLEGNPYVDELIPFDRATPGGLRRTWKRIRAGFQIAVDFQGLVQSALVAAFASPDQIIGFHRSQARERAAAVVYSTEVQTRQTHIVDRYLELAAAAGAKNMIRDFPVPPGHAEGQLPESRFILASPFAGWGAKEWPLEYYERLAEKLEMPLVLNGPASAWPALERIRGASVHISGIPGLIDATRRAAAVIGVDSGPLHLAAALAKPGVAIFGPTDPARNGPYGSTLRILRDAKAETSYKRNKSNESMRAIAPEAVLDALREALSARPAGCLA
jgi:heptosyltransferase-1